MTHKKPIRIIAALVALFFSWTLAGGATAAHAANLATQQAAAVPAASAKRAGAGEKFARSLAGVETLLADESLPLASKQREVKARRAELATTAAELRGEFAATAKKLKTAKLAPEILERQQRFVDQFEDNLATLTAELATIESAKDEIASQSAIAKARAHLARSKAPSRHQPLDPNNLPHRSAEPTKQQPRLKKEEFERAYGKDLAALPRPVRVAAAGSLTGIIPANNDAPANLGLPSLDDLAGTVDAPYSPAIEAKALELGHDPLKIYNWVRNTIEFVPTWGSIQGAQLTLETKQGNAFDTASLLVALLRASHIEARYVMGTVTLPIDKIQNWAGGFSDPMAALDFMSSGGIPTTAISEGGKVTQARFEHVWVEAWIDYFPSRGARHQDGQGEMWVPLDASYKQYTYTQGLDLQAAVPFDAQNFVDQLKSTATINEAQGYATGVNATLVQQSLSDYQSRVEAYIAEQHPNATVGDVLGKKEIVVKDYPMLAGTLPYKTAVRGGAYALLPASLRHQMSFKLFTGDGQNTDITVTRSLPELAGKKITLSYSPATNADEQLLLSYVGKGETSLPAYLINLKPEFRIDGQIVATGSTITMGTQQQFDMEMNSPPYGTNFISNKLIAGTYNAVALNLGAVSAAQAEASAVRAKAVKAKLEQQDLTGITKDDVMGEFLHAHGLTYWGIVDFTNKMASAATGVVRSRLPSEGIFAYNLNITDLFGMPVAATPTGFATDIDSDLHVVLAKDGSKEKPVAFMTQSGMIGSRMEAGVYDLSFNKTYTGRGVSAAHVLEEANLLRIPIYTVTATNINTVLPQLQVSAEVKVDIRNAVNRGKTVTIPERELSKDDWTGTGYIIYDGTTGAGAYMISDGLAGGGYDCECWGCSPIEEFIGNMFLSVVGLIPGINAALLSIASMVFGLYNFSGTVCKINNDTALKDYQQFLLTGFVCLMFALGVIVTVCVLASPTAPLAILIPIVWTVYSLVVSLITDELIDLTKFFNSRNSEIDEL